MTRYLLAVNLGIVLGALTGCGAGLELSADAAKAVEDISHGVQQADEGSRDLYTFALSLCEFAPTKEKGDDCAAKLKALSMPVRRGFGAIRVAYCAIKPEEPSCKEPFE